MVLEPSASRRRRRSPHRRIAFWAAGGVIVVCACALGLVLLMRPQVVVTQDSEALARISTSVLEGRVVSASAKRVDGRAIPISLRKRRLWPVGRIPVNERVLVQLTMRRPGWASRLLGATDTRTFVVRTPVAHVEARWLVAPSRGPVTFALDAPVEAVHIRRGSHEATIRFPRPRSRVVVGRVARGLPRAGAATISAVPRTWEIPPHPVRVSWFPAGQGVQAFVEPAPGSSLRPNQPITLTFAKPVRQVLGEQLPTVTPDVGGRWHVLDAHTISFRPTSFGFPLDGRVAIQLPTPVRFASTAREHALQTVAWSVLGGSILRLHQLLAEAGYLPVAWQPAADPARPTARFEAAAATDPPAGRFSWRWPDTPAELRKLWRPDAWNEITRGAVMMFENTHGLSVDGFVGPKVWHALLADSLAGRRSSRGYSYVFVHRSVPQSLNLWHDGQVILSSPGNTGVPAAPTQLGTFPVFEHIPVGTMSGTNPDGTHYHDPGIQYISYFNHGDAIHAFNRSSFGTPQSLGCVELPLAAAAKVWPYTPIGTLVTVEN
jgi:hypothetical protein